MKIYDTFIFFNELDLLEIRLNILNDFVDYFVLVESTRTFTGNDKPLYYQENKDRFKDFNHKIIHIVVDDMPNSAEELNARGNVNSIQRDIIRDCLTTPNVPRGAAHWLREFYQKEQIKRGLVNAEDEDFVLISDLDEIWDPNIEFDFSFNGNYRLNQKVFTYYLNNRSSEDWHGTVASKYKNIKNYSVNHIRTPNRNQYQVIPNGGWHFTFQGGKEAIKNKIEAYSHQEKNNNSIKSNIARNMELNIDVFGRRFKLWVDNDNLPTYIKNNKEKYKHLIK